MQPTDDPPLVLVVDDEPAVRSLLGAVLGRLGYPVRLAASGPEAAAWYRRERGRVGLVLMDVRMPGMDGPQTLESLRAIDPGVRCCFMSANTAPYTDSQLFRRAGRKVLRKPFGPGQVADAVRSALGGPAGAAP
jgi:CheY-like chemotaxis protein